jgi:hypothetical protein
MALDFLDDLFRLLGVAAPDFVDLAACPLITKNPASPPPDVVAVWWLVAPIGWYWTHPPSLAGQYGYYHSRYLSVEENNPCCTDI